MNTEEGTGREESRPVAVPATTQVTYQHIARSGPMPDSQELDNYDKVVPGLANRIAIQFEKEGDHRRDMERIELGADNRQRNWGMLAGSSLQFALIIGGFALALLDHEVTAGIMIGSGAIPTLSHIWKDWHREGYDR